VDGLGRRVLEPQPLVVAADPLVVAHAVEAKVPAGGGRRLPVGPLDDGLAEAAPSEHAADRELVDVRRIRSGNGTGHWS
jgi:hypothetical protein